MPTLSYRDKRGQLEAYFDRTAADAWSRLTSNAPVSRIRATVRAGREQMRGTLLDWLPTDLGGRRVLDAGCGTGLLAVDAARRGAEVVAIDLSPTLVGLARERAPRDLGDGGIDFRVGDMLELGDERFDHAIAMDSLIHYRLEDALRVVAALAGRVERSVLFTFAPRTPALALMHATGRLFPRADRAPVIEPIAPSRLQRAIAAEPALEDWHSGRTRRVHRGFYISQALELAR